ncbi:isovaleryl-CoA dehydrogenase [Paragonimus westermani]|uniref:Isovaleryl-CoA dehydrogenase n=1 Tax=Paragonimus westermani TaxID=34504 RepID=A0A5J4N7I9_9TREM|nr:isovaleryl-CoA dehydrogenase [Paragonimus westermani]
MNQSVIYRFISRARFKLFCRSKISQFPTNDDLHDFSDEQKHFRKTLQSFVCSEVYPIANTTDVMDTVGDMRSLWKKFGAMGLLGVTAPGVFQPSTNVLIQKTMEEISRASGSIGLSYGAHSNLCVNQLVRHASEDQAQRYLPGLISGDLIGALAMSEVGSGSDVVSMQTKAEKHGDHYILNGSKFWITNGPDADIVIVYAKTEPKIPEPKHGISAFIVETSTPGFSVGQKIKKLGMRGSNTAELIFENCKIPASNLLGELNRGVYVLMSGLDVERLILSAGPLGLMQACCDVAFEYAQERCTFGRPIADYGMIQAKMADMYTRLQVSRTYTYAVARLIDHLDQQVPEQKAGSTNTECASVILHNAEAATKVALDAIQILGEYLPL